jgi:hypothetical protein
MILTVLERDDIAVCRSSKDLQHFAGKYPIVSVQNSRPRFNNNSGHKSNSTFNLNVQRSTRRGGGNRCRDTFCLKSRRDQFPFSLDIGRASPRWVSFLPVTEKARLGMRVSRDLPNDQRVFRVLPEASQATGRVNWPWVILEFEYVRDRCGSKQAAELSVAGG